MKRLRTWLHANEQGQSIIIIALFFFLAFLVFGALAVDGTVIYLHRRRLQNMADAAALAAALQLSQNKDEAAAYQTAMDSIETNLGRIEWYSTADPPNPPSTNDGSGVDLNMGIEITNACEVRVALNWSDVGTYFAQFVGRPMLQVGARARASCSRAGGLQPIAIKRFGDERDWNFSLTNSNQATVFCDHCSTQQALDEQGLGNANDFLRPQGLDVLTTWPGWPTGEEMYVSPSPHADLDSGAAGREYYILGASTDPNVGTTSYAGLVNLDIRHISAPPLEYYNGVEPGTQSNTLKDLGEYYIRRGYCCDIPRPGDQVAMYNGGSTSFSPVALQETYAISDIIAVIVYNGHVFDAPNLYMTGTPENAATYPATTTITSDYVLTYSLELEAKNGFQSAAAGLTMNVEGLDDFAEWRFVPTASPVLGRNGINLRTITLVVTPTTTTVGTTTHVITGTRMFYVSAIDDKMGGSKIKRYWAGTATIGEEVNGIQYDQPAVTCTPTNSDRNYPYSSVVEGQQAQYSIELNTWGISSDQSLTVSAGALPSSNFEWVKAPPWIRTTLSTKHPGASFRISVKASEGAAATNPYVIPLSVSAPGIAPQACNLYILVESAGSTVKEYVEILGYAAVQITGYFNNEHPVTPGQPANAVRGRIVSRLMSDPSDLTYGLRARLIPWEQ